jgi:bifunctional enzyme CysN/CysC
MDDQRAMNEGEVYRIKQTTRSAKAVVKDIEERFNVTTLTGEPNPESLRLNEIGRINLQLSSPLVFDNYTTNRTTGSFVLINQATNATVAAGMIGEPPFSFNQAELLSIS